MKQKIMEKVKQKAGGKVPAGAAQKAPGKMKKPKKPMGY